MENNNFQNDVNNNLNQVSGNANQANTNKSKKNGNAKTVFLMIIVLVLVLIIGILTGLFISGNGDKVTNIFNQVTEKKEENKTSKKIDENKAWVYDADYMKDKEDKVKTSIYNPSEFKASEVIKLPYININSDDAKNVNEEIKAMFDEAYDEFGELVALTNVVTGEKKYSEDNFSYTGYDYKFYENNNILSIVISKYEVTVPGDGGPSYITYNFDLETLKLINITDVLQAYGFNSKSDFNTKMIAKIRSISSQGEAVAEDMSNWDGTRFFIKNNKINVFVPGLAYGEYIVEVDSSIENTVVETSYFEKNKNLNYSSNPKDDINGKVAIIKMGEEIFQKTMNDGYYTYTDNFSNSYNIKEITNITSEYKNTTTDGTTNLFKAVIEYIDNNNVKKSFDTAVFVPNDANNYITLSIFGPYDNYTGSTNYVKAFTDLYDEGINDSGKLNGEFIRPDDTERTTGNLIITNATNHSFEFKLNATHINALDIEEAKARGGVNIGEVTGYANKISYDTYEFVADKDEMVMDGFDSEYRIYFIIKSDSSIEIQEIYDHDKYSQGPYGGANVRFVGVYNK